ncbi:bluf domain protein [Flavobacterium sp. TP390]|uniref:Bluf domain protein n=1 Tax=Flavobacterium profundi TaxID=1774945 RepID=A0A6I4IFJ7_9FLAO|nr:BLUF domain-containing protein [Flavobacterium profundi]MVO08394.1 bluf domain protein [Flavobacterium profundi]
MYRIIYLSSATTKFTNEEILTLLNASRKNNEANEITGLLLYSDGNFLQIIEGKQKKIKALYAKINMDQRHRNIIKVFEGKVSHRIYPKWHMGFNSIDKEFENQTIGTDSYQSISSEDDLIASTFIATFLKSNKEKMNIK